MSGVVERGKGEGDKEREDVPLRLRSGFSSWAMVDEEEWVSDSGDGASATWEEGSGVM